MNQTSTAQERESALGERVITASFTTSQGLSLQASVRRLTPKTVTFELISPEAVLQVSEVLTGFQLATGTGVVYKGQAVVSSLMQSGGGTICEASLAGSLLEASFFQNRDETSDWSKRFQGFLQGWQNFYRVLPDFKLAVADLQHFLEALRLWLDQVEVELAALPEGERRQREQALLRELPAAAALNPLFERFERVAAQVPEELAPAHRELCRQLHDPLLLSPFNHRIYAKPLGYAGDYRMIEMILRNQFEGASLFAKIIHAYILDQGPARSVRNRADYFVARFREEAARVSAQGRIASFYSLGCGPAGEVQRFLSDDPLCERVRFRLLDFNSETLSYTGQRLEKCRREHGRGTPIEMVQNSVHSLLKATTRPEVGGPRFDMIYCSGLYDYLNDRVCKALNTYLYEQLLPGGVLFVTNFDPCNPIRNLMEFVFEWFLIHRDARQMATLTPEQAAPDHCRVEAEPTGCNVFLVARKPLSAK